MPHGKTQFQKSWLGKTDRNGHLIGSWLKEDSTPYTVTCTLCASSFKCDNSGFQQVMSHADGKGHKAIASQRFSKIQQHFSTSERPGACVLSSRSHNDQVTVAEAAWCMKVAASNYSYNSCEDLPDLFRFMFPCPYINDFSLGRSKVSYVISDGLGPYFQELLCKTIRKEGNPFTLQFDETVTVQNQKQLDLLIRFWSEEKGEVVTRFLKALFFGHAKGDIVADSIVSTVEEVGLNKEQFLSMRSDGPNVNKTIWKRLNEHLKGLGFPGLVEFMPCNVHVVHNGFKHALSEYGQHAEQLALDLFYWFKAHPTRKEDYFKAQTDLGFDEQLFIRHVQSRWLTLIPALMRIVDNWEPIRSYFLKELPKVASAERTLRVLEKNETYRRICKAIQEKDALIQMHFLISVKPVFDGILGTFQRQEPLIHILHNECLQLVKRLMLRFLKSEVADTNSKKLVQLDVQKSDHQLPDSRMEIGEQTRKMLSTLQPNHQKIALSGMRTFFQSTTIYLLNHLPIGDTFVRDLTILHPDMREIDAGDRCIRRIAQSLPQVVKDYHVPLVVDEWKLYRRQEIPEDWFKTDEAGSTRIDHYWARVIEIKTLSGTEMFPYLKKLIKAVLTLSHGNADVERSLSVNKQAIGTNRTLLTHESLNGIRQVKDAVSAADGKVHAMDFSKELISCTRNANERYRQRLEEQKKQEEAQKNEKVRREEAEKQKKIAEEKAFEERKRKLKETEKELQKQHEEHQSKLKAAEALFSEANQRLADAVKSKDFKNKVVVAQGLLEIAHKEMKTAQSEMEDWQKRRASLDSKRLKMIDNAKH